jgi:Xaa-Pro aminopeptidase
MPTKPSSTQGAAPELVVDVPARLAAIDQRKLRAYRLDRVRAELRRRDYAGALLGDPLNIRYATGSRNMSVWTAHAPGRWAFVPTEGPVVLYEFSSSMHVSRDLETIGEIHPCVPWTYFLAGPRTEEKAALWAGEIAAMVAKAGGKNRRLAIDRCDPSGALKLAAAGLELHDGQEAVEQARLIKSPEEIQCLRLSMEVCDTAIAAMRRALRPGLTENQLWSILHEVNIAHDGEWIECRLLASGERTNPWFQECSNRVIAPGDIVAFDTDMVGPTGYLADISRSWVCPGKTPTDEQRRLYAIAEEQVLHNIGILKPGLGFREFAERCWPVPERFVPNRYMMMVHGVGLVDEYPSVAYASDFADWGYDGRFEENMVVSVESYIGEVGGREGVKLEQQVLIGAAGAEAMSATPFEEALAVE